VTAGEPGSSPVVVVGAGVMGAGIAGLFAQAGFPTAIVDVNDEVLERASRRASRRYDVGDRLRMSTDLEAAATGAAIAIEAVPERLELKHEVVARLTEVAPHNALLATNTSTISIARIAERTDAPRFLGMHFFNPVHRMQLVELVVGPETAPATLERASQVVEQVGKTRIVVRDAPGFATSRLGIALGNEAMRMLGDGVASAADIDTAMRLGYGHPMGPFELADLVGLDARLNNTRSMFEQTGQEHFQPPQVLERLVDEGKLGKKSGAGFYTYPDV
jgi:3-hydroxybutyryl-CoA dehydrogenase